MSSRIFYSLLGLGLTAVVAGAVSMCLGPFAWSQRAFVTGLFLFGAAFVANAIGGMKEKKVREGSGAVLTLQESGRVVFTLSVAMSLLLGVSGLVCAYMLW